MSVRHLKRLREWLGCCGFYLVVTKNDFSATYILIELRMKLGVHWVLEFVNMDHICCFAIRNFIQFPIIDARANSNGNYLHLFSHRSKEP